MAVSLMSMKAAFNDPLRLTKRSVNALRPADFTDYFVTLMFVNQVMNLEKHALILPSRLSVCHLLETVKEPITNKITNLRSRIIKLADWLF